MANSKGRNDNELHIKNPQRTVLRIWLFILVLFTLLLVKSFVSFDINSLDGMIIVTSLMIIPTSLFFVWTTSKNIKNLDEAIDRGKMIAHWRYSEKEWVAYLDFERSYRKNLGTMIAALLTVFTVVIFVPFAIVVQEFFMIIVMPNTDYYIRKFGNRDSLCLDDIKKENIIFTEENSSLRTYLDTSLIDKEISFDSYLEFGNVESTKKLVKYGFGVAILPFLSV